MAETYVVEGTVLHSGKKFEHGSAFPADAATAEEIAELRRLGFLKLETEVRNAEDLQSELERLRAENAALRTPVEEADADGASAADDSGVAGDVDVSAAASETRETAARRGK